MEVTAYINDKKYEIEKGESILNFVRRIFR